MPYSFTVSGRIARPVHEVFEAVADPANLSNYFTTGGATGRIEPGATVTWDFADFPGAFPVDVVEVVPDARIVLRWDAHEGAVDRERGSYDAAGYQTTVTMTFAPLDGGARTLVSIHEQGWRETPAALTGSYENCMGWSQMLSAMKAWLEHRINLREGMYV